MKKLVNGKVVDIQNIDLFIRAAEDTALCKPAISVTSDGIRSEIQSPELQRYIYMYDLFFKSLPYPLYAVEDDIKYATLGQFMKFFDNTDDTLPKMWVSKGLYVLLNETSGMAIHFVNNTWGISYVQSANEDNTSLDNYKDHVGYRDYSWVYGKLTKMESTAGYYEECMPKFFEACGNQEMVLKWELSNILTFGSIPKPLNLHSNRIVDLDKNKEYMVDMYFSGYKDTKDKVEVWNLTKGTTSVTHRKLKTYDYDLYEKSLDSGITGNKIKQSNLPGITGLFLVICGMKNEAELDYFPEFEGFIVGTNLIYCVNGRMYIGKSNRVTEHKLICQDAELYSCDRGMVYYKRLKNIGNGVVQETIYSLSLSDNTKRLCKISYR